MYNICLAPAEPTKDARVVGQGQACFGVNLDKVVHTVLSTLDELVGGPVCQATSHNVPCLKVRAVRGQDLGHGATLNGLHRHSYRMEGGR